MAKAPTILLPRIVWLCVILSITGAANAQFYYPDQKDYGTPSDYGLKYEEVFFPSSNGTILHAWYISSLNQKTRGTVVHFHGNAQNMSSHLSGVAWLARRGFDLFLFDYRGYGKSDGTPSRDGIFQDCIAAIEKAQQLSPPSSRLILFGQSLGATNAIAVYGEEHFDRIAGIAAEAPFSSYQAIAKDKAGILGGLVSNTKSPSLVVQNISPTPLLLVHGTMDRVVPVKHSRELYKLAEHPKEIWEVAGARHLRIFNNQYYHDKLVRTFEQWIDGATDAPEQ